jgi:hypothetical protein
MNVLVRHVHFTLLEAAIGDHLGTQMSRCWSPSLGQTLDHLFMNSQETLLNGNVHIPGISNENKRKKLKTNRMISRREEKEKELASAAVRSKATLIEVTENLLCAK